MTKIFIATNPGFFNKGDAALVLGALKTLRSIDNTEVCVISAYPEYESYRCDARLISNADTLSKERTLIVRVIGRSIPLLQHTLLAMLHRIFGINITSSRIQKREIWEEYRKSDIIIVALDDSFTTLYGIVSFRKIIYSFFIAKLLNKLIVFYAGSIGPFKNRFYEILGRYVLNRADLITLREEISFEYLKKIGVNNPSMYVTADLAFTLHPASLERAKEIFASEGINENERQLIGISLSRVISRWAFPDIHDNEEKYLKYIKIMAEVVDYIIEKLSATVVFIPQVLGPTRENEDRNTAKDIYQLIKNKNYIKLITNEYTPEELRVITGQFDLFIGARTHSIISAAMMCTPFVAIEYESHKTRGIIGKMLNCEEFIYDIRKLDFDTLMAKINEVWLNRDKIRNELQIKIDGMEERALLNGKLVKELIITNNLHPHIHSVQ